MIRTGLLLIAAAFAVVAPLRTLDGPAAAIAFTVLLTLGQMVVPPATRALLTDLADEQRLGLATGALSSLSGLAVVAAGAPIGALLDHDGPPLGSSSPPSAPRPRTGTSPPRGEAPSEGTRTDLQGVNAALVAAVHLDQDTGAPPASPAHLRDVSAKVRMRAYGHERPWKGNYRLMAQIDLAIVENEAKAWFNE